MSDTPNRQDRARSARGVDEIARGESGLASALRRAEAYLALDRRIRTALGDAVPPGLRVACVEDGRLIVAADGPAAATRARWAADAMLAEAGRHWPEKLRGVKIVVVPGMGEA
ncbi:MAG: DciA family protein [Wenzhouxiangellaceae bacterium]|nr:DciA family protein [Wenzhouxiangellaceae bacterium]